jgi:hypothetical protein
MPAFSNVQGSNPPMILYTFRRSVSIAGIEPCTVPFFLYTLLYSDVISTVFGKTKIC